jgi:hypothetical protein
MASPLTSDEAVAVGATAAAKEQHLRGPAPPHATGVEPHAALIHATTPLCPLLYPSPLQETQPKRRKEEKTILEPGHASARSGVCAQKHFTGD